MSTATLYGVSAVLWIAGAIWFDQLTVALFVAFAHMISWQIHVVEVKLNKLLDERGIFVSSAEIRD